jgi:dipeptidyl-peptidase-4
MAAALCLSAASCRKDERPATVPALEGRRPRLADLRAEMRAIVGDPPVGGHVPEALAWSQSGKSLAFLRSRPWPKKGKDLWLHELAGHRERPLTGLLKDAAVDAFCFISDSEVLASQAGELVLISTVDGRDRALTRSHGTIGDFACGGTGGKVAFVRSGNVYVLDTTSGVETPLTSDATADLVHGEVPWLYQEELDYGPGLLWSADGRRLLWLTTDLSGVRRVSVWKTVGELERQVYPLPGETLPRTYLSVTSFQKDGAATTTRLQTGETQEAYLVRPVWHPSSEQVLVWRLDRLQTLQELLTCGEKGVCKVLSEHRDPRFLEPPPAVMVLSTTGELLLRSSASGSPHIHVLSAEGLHLRQLTSGSYEVDSIDRVDEARGLVYFTANAESSSEHLLYSVPLRGGKVRRVSDCGGNHIAVWSKDASHYADVQSDVDRPPRLVIRGVDEESGTVAMPQDLAPYKPLPVTTDYFDLETADGRKLRAALTRPQVLSAVQRYPVLIYVYGGPGAQTVNRKWNRKLSAWRNSLAHRGVLVFSLDGRGAKGYGRANAEAIHTRLLGPEVEDQIAGLSYLRRQPYVDPARIGVFGWSYGGSMALALAMHPEAGKQLRAAVSVAPVTDFARYDATYTERYLQRPQDNPAGYARTDLTAQAKNLSPALLLIHGIADDNVHFEHSARLLRALLDAGRPVETAFYPDESHGLKGREVLADAFVRVIDFLMRNL